jgi:hypothetical protein
MTILLAGSIAYVSGGVVGRFALSGKVELPNAGFWTTVGQAIETAIVRIIRFTHNPVEAATDAGL